MVKIKSQEYIGVSILVVSRIRSALPFDLFILRSESAFTKLFHKGSPVDKDRLKTYATQKHVSELFVHTEDYREYRLYVEQVAAQILEKAEDYSPEDFTEIIRELTEISLLELYKNSKLDENLYQTILDTTSGCVGLLTINKMGLMHIAKRMLNHGYLLQHSVTSTIVALLMAQAVEIRNQKNLISVGLGGLLHDIGISQITFDPEQKAFLSPEEWKEMKEHPMLGKKMVDSVRAVSPEVRLMIMQHHEQPNGLGYPNGLRNKDIFYLAKIIAIADGFSALIHDRPFRQAFTIEEALSRMSEDRGKYDAELLRKLNLLLLGNKSED